MVYKTKNRWVSRRCRSSGTLNIRQHNVSETDSVSVIRWRGDANSVGRRLVSFTSRSFSRWGRKPCYPWDRRLGGPQSRSRRPYGVSNSDLSAVHPVASLCAVCDIPSPVKNSWLWNATNNTSVLSHLFARYCCRDTVTRSYDLCVSQTAFQHVNCSDMRPFYYPWN
jgi:hypothetical protein